jgi:hypothetical protein
MCNVFLAAVAAVAAAPPDAEKSIDKPALMAVKRFVFTLLLLLLLPSRRRRC